MTKYSRRHSKKHSKKYKPWIHSEGKLGGPGFLHRSRNSQKRILSKCVKKHGYKSCLGSIMVLERSRKLNKLHGSKLRSLHNWIRKSYGRR
jgi:hypothetical protein